MAVASILYNLLTTRLICVIKQTHAACKMNILNYSNGYIEIN